MQKTPFAGFTRLAPGEPLNTDGFSFQDLNPVIADQLLRLAVVAHQHDDHDPLSNPTTPPVAETLPTGGTIPSGVVLRIGYTLLDAQGGETILSPLAMVATVAGVATPATAPTVAHDATAGELLADTYLYAVTVTDGVGGETALGPAAMVTVPAGTATNRITISGLQSIVTAAGGTGWRLWRMVGGGPWARLETGASDSVVDDGTLCADASLTPPSSTANTQATSRLRVTVPAVVPAEAERLRVYATEEEEFGSPSLLADLPISQAGVMQEFTAFNPLGEAPPFRSLAFGGAQKIDAETDTVNLSWRGPVADAAALPAADNTQGDVRLTLDDLTLNVWDGATWQARGTGHAILAEGVALPAQPDLDFVGNVSVTDDAANGKTVVTVTSSIANAVPWDAGTAYAGSEVVTHNGSSYVAATSTTVGAAPDVTPAEWWTLAERGQAGPPVARSTVAWTTAGLADAASESSVQPIGKGFILYRVQTDAPARVRLYTTTAKRNADEARAIGADPIGNHGLILDIATTTADLDWHLAPAVYGMNLEAVPDENVGVIVTNLSGATTPVTVTITRVVIDVVL